MVLRCQDNTFPGDEEILCRFGRTLEPLVFYFSCQLSRAGKWFLILGHQAIFSFPVALYICWSFPISLLSEKLFLIFLSVVCIFLPIIAPPGISTSGYSMFRLLVLLTRA